MFDALLKITRILMGRVMEQRRSGLKSCLTPLFLDMSAKEQVAELVGKAIDGAVEIQKAKLGSGEGSGTDTGDGAGGPESGAVGSHATTAGSTGDAAPTGGQSTPSAGRDRTPTQAEQASDARTVVNKLREDGIISDADARSIMVKQFNADTPSSPVHSSVPDPEGLAWQGSGPISSLTTWAGAVTMMMSWRDCRELRVPPYRIEDALTLLDSGRSTPIFLDRWRGNQGIYRPISYAVFDEVQDLFTASHTREGAVPLVPDDLIPFTERDLPTAALLSSSMTASGPIWITYDAKRDLATPGFARLFGLHSVIMTRITGDGTPAGTQIEYRRVTDSISVMTESLEVFYARLKDMMLNADWGRVYMISFRSMLLPPRLR